MNQFNSFHIETLIIVLFEGKPYTNCTCGSQITKKGQPTHT